MGIIFGNPEVTPGGRALKFYSSLRLDVRKIDTIKDGSSIIGNRVRVKVVKNKVAPPFKEAVFDLMFASGASQEGGIIDLGVEYNIVEKAGSWFSYNGQRLGQGRDNARKFLEENKAIADEIKEKIYEIVS